MGLSYKGRTLRAIDVHTHVPRREGAKPQPWAEQMERYFGVTLQKMTLEETADFYRRLEMLAVVFDLDMETVRDYPFVGNDYLAEIQQRYPDVFICWAAVDPHKGRAAVKELERAVTQLGLRGLKLHPICQEFYPNDEAYYPLWDKAQELGIPVLFHSGHTGLGVGEPGGTGLKLSYSRPIPYLDELAASFPHLTIIAAHPSWPWQEEMLAVAMHKGNVYIDLSGWSPKYFPPSLIRYANTLLKDKVLFGSDFPALSPERWLRDFEKASFQDDVRPKILLENAWRVLKLGES